MRGGTSRALVFRSADLPPDHTDQDRVFLSAMGSPDPHRRQIDGVGGGHPLTSKVAVVGPSSRPDHDVDFDFAQVHVTAERVERGSSCGNIAAAVGPFAIDEGMVAAAGPVTTVRIFNTNTGKTIVSRVPTSGGRFDPTGPLMIPGVRGTGAPIELEFVDPAGATTRTLLPTGRATDVVGPDVEVSIVDAGTLAVFVRMADAGVSREEPAAALDADEVRLAALERIRAEAAVLCGLAATPEGASASSRAVPKLVLVAPPADEADLLVKALSMGRVHGSLQVTASVALAAAAAIPGTVVAASMDGNREGDVLRVAHPAGVTELRSRLVQRDGAWDLESATVQRTARRLMEGRVFIDGTAAGVVPSSAPATAGLDIESIRERFAARGIGARVGFGASPAVVVVDVTRAFTDPSLPLGADPGGMVDAINGVVAAARAAGAPVVHTVAVYDPVAEVWGMKIPSNREVLPGTPGAELDPRLDVDPADEIVVKHHASAFFGTELAQSLRTRSVDTLIVTGMTTSGCVRATAVDGCSLGFRIVVPEEAVADRADLSHVVSLFDIDAKYGDVLPADDVEAFLRSLATGARPEPGRPAGYAYRSQ
jgi:2-methylaconitate cis-trans-isomerase PrpF/nicotinamidase-related amidase